ncbi:hypothetical protein DBV14_15480 [Variovorax sp. KBW07]|uniref:BcsR/BcsP family cellulose biosynthesis protein n=1 Tax=Variovorax sp. KBW07 TaxID=2153358 RepID=UPI000F581B30|nr:BcsR/BcsP family cellulose biosynthesis protein [Variovorax sp. KBW07]RQO52853.1 hypothetical protein DBV14_15480 [Variovorax sp. KBW07]
MSQDDDTPEDIAGLFRKFGGDAHAYKEFAPPEAEGEAPKAWPLLSGEKIERAPFVAPAIAPAAAPVRAPAPAPTVAPLPPVAAVPPARVEPVLRPPVPPAPAFAPAPQAPAQADTRHSASTPLEQLFARLAAPQPPAAAQGPMSRWRRPT